MVVNVQKNRPRHPDRSGPLSFVEEYGDRRAVSGTEIKLCGEVHSGMDGLCVEERAGAFCCPRSGLLAQGQAVLSKG